MRHRSQPGLNLTGLFIAPWLLSAVLSAISPIDYDAFIEPSVLLVTLPALFAWLWMRSLRSGWKARRRHAHEGAVATPSWRLFAILCGLAMAGNLALLRAYSGIVGPVDSGSQEAYVALVSGEITADTGLLGTFGHLLRVAQPLAVICAILLFVASRRWRDRLIIAALTMFVVYVGYLASMSRGQFLLVGACAVGTLLRVGVSRSRLMLVTAALVAGGLALFRWTTASRYEVLGVDSDVVASAMENLFRITPGNLSAPWVEMVGAHSVGLFMYLTQPLVECYRLIESDPSPYFFGSLTFRPFVNPLARIAGVTLDTALPGRVTNPNMWYSLLGDLYLDFGAGALIALPLLCVGMYWAATRYSTTDSGVIPWAS